jgi:hypothetical protein
MTIDPSVQPGGFGERRPISHEEVLRLRRHVWADGNVTPDEAAELFEMNTIAEPSNEWTDFFVEALCDYLIGRGEPRGYVTEQDMRWLIANIDRDGRIESHAELELLVKLLERAEYVPDALKQFALREIEQTILTGSGPTRNGGEIVPGQITEGEARLLRRLVFAPAGDGPARVSRSEAEMLFRLKDATLGADNAPDWSRLFVQAVANHLMAHAAYDPPARDVAARLQGEYKPDPFGVVTKLGRDLASIKEAFGESESDRIQAHDAEVAGWWSRGGSNP